MNWVVTIYSALLFFILTPGILLRLPPKGKPMTVAIFHAVVFAIVWYFTHKLVWKLSNSFKIESFEETTPPSESEFESEIESPSTSPSTSPSQPSKNPTVDPLKLQLGNLLNPQ